MKTDAPILFNSGVKKDNPDKIPVPNKEPEIIPPKEPQPDMWPRKVPEIQPEKEPVTTPPLPPQIPFPEQTLYTQGIKNEATDQPKRIGNRSAI